MSASSSAKSRACSIAMAARFAKSESLLNSSSERGRFAKIAMDLGTPFSFVDLYRGYACYAEIARSGSFAVIKN